MKTENGQNTRLVSFTLLTIIVNLEIFAIRDEIEKPRDFFRAFLRESPQKLLV